MRERRQSALAYVVTVGLSLALLTWVLELWRADLSVPLIYGGDSLLVQLLVKSTVENGWYLTNGFVGAPFGLEMHDFPFVDSVFHMHFRIVSWFTPNYVRVLNVYYLLTFPLAAASALFVFRRFRVPRAPAVVGGLLFAFLPYHFIRGEEHLFLASYFLVPLAILAVLWVYLEGGPIVQRDATENAPKFQLDRMRALALGVICLLLGCGGVYYAFFTCYLLLVSGVGAALWRKRLYPLGYSTAAVALVCVGVLANLAPTIAYRLAHGPNPEAVVRDPAQAEIFGLKLAQLVLPVSGHRLAAFAALKARYDTSLASLVNENTSSAIGIIAAVGFLVLTSGFLWRRASERPQLWDGLVVSNLAAVLLATFGGFGTLFGFLASPWIRGYNRMSVFIAFLALFAVVLGLGKLDRMARSVAARLVFIAALGAVLIVGVMDQTTTHFVPNYALIRQLYKQDAEFIQRVEASLPSGAMVFQLPYSLFPEPMNVHEMQWYDPLRGYLHSKNLRWSYGATCAGRYGYIWQARVADEAPREMVQTLAAAGFSGITIDRTGYPDAARRLEADLAKLLDLQPELSQDKRFVFFNLTRYADSASSRA